MVDVDWNELGSFGLSLSVAAVIGAVCSLHPMRLKRQRAASDFDWDQVRAQILIAVAGALMVLVVGDSMARAFGLVGVGGFIRFRTAIRNPADTAFLFLLIGFGMACGLGHYAIAITGTVFLWIIFCVLELGKPGRPVIDSPHSEADEALF